MLSKAFYVKLFLVYLICNPVTSIFALSLAATTAMAIRIVIHPQTKSSDAEREMGAVEQHLESIDSRIKDQEESTEKEFLEKQTESTARWIAVQETLNKINLRFDANEQDERIYRERVIGDEKIVFGFLACITFFGGASFLKKWFGGKSPITLMSVNEEQLESSLKPSKRTVKRGNPNR